MNHTKIPEKEEATTVAVIFLLIILPVIGGIVLAATWKWSKSEECDGKPESPQIKEVSGNLSYAHRSFYIPGENRNWVVYRCGRGCTGNKSYVQFKDNIGKPVKAAFCNNQLLWFAPVTGSMQ